MLPISRHQFKNPDEESDEDKSCQATPGRSDVEDLGSSGKNCKVRLLENFSVSGVKKCNRSSTQCDLSIKDTCRKVPAEPEETRRTSGLKEWLQVLLEPLDCLESLLSDIKERMLSRKHFLVVQMTTELIGLAAKVTDHLFGLRADSVVDKSEFDSPLLKQLDAIQGWCGSVKDFLDKVDPGYTPLMGAVTSASNQARMKRMKILLDAGSIPRKEFLEQLKFAAAKEAEAKRMLDPFGS